MHTCLPGPVHVVLMMLVAGRLGHSPSGAPQCPHIFHLLWKGQDPLLNMIHAAGEAAMAHVAVHSFVWKR